MCYKLKHLHIKLIALSQLKSKNNIIIKNINANELNCLYSYKIIFIKMSDMFCKKMKQSYKNNFKLQNFIN